MQGQSCVVTGASTGIGKAMATELARRGADTSGEHFVDRRARTPSQAARDPADARGLWERTLELTGL